jgi:MFS family permease
MSAAIFYLGFIVGVYPAMMLAQRFPIERVASAIVTVWGVCLICTVLCVNYQGLYAQRFFLGLLESGISPMFMVIVVSIYHPLCLQMPANGRFPGFFLQKERTSITHGVSRTQGSETALRLTINCRIWYSCTGYVSVVSPLINYGFGSIDPTGSSWKYMYYFAGALTVAWGLALYFFLLPDPVRAKGFSERERYIMVARLRSNNSGVRNTHLKVGQIRELLLDLKFWLMFFAATLSMIANGKSIVNTTITPVNGTIQAPSRLSFRLLFPVSDSADCTHSCWSCQLEHMPEP